MFTARDLEQIRLRGMTPEQVEKQLENFRKGFPPADLVSPAVRGDGIHVFNEEQIQQLQDYYHQNLSQYDIIKFVPASGAATRMFKHLFEFLEWFDGSEASFQRLEQDKGFQSVYHFLKNIQRFAFIRDLKNVLTRDGYDLSKLMNERNYRTVIEYLLFDKGLGYASLPKALLMFHQYDGFSRMAIGEHLAEAAQYVRKPDNTVKVHFTVSPEHLEKFYQYLDRRLGGYESMYGVKYFVEFSQQKPSTDTIAVDMDNQPFRESDGSLHFRPGGHGALIENLNDLDEEIIFIKNIDNVVPDRLKEPTIKYKKVIGGLLLQLVEKTRRYLQQLETRELSPDDLRRIATFARTDLMIRLPEDFDQWSTETKVSYLFAKLNRPIRVCGMVKNEGEPGGGPFWVRNSKGEISLQIVESSQINMNDEQQKKIALSATHFNPVDLVCCIKDYKGNKFDLTRFIDPSTGFISIKSKDGRELKAQELPGLWNGAMADWITVFVEVPIITFNPVKTINDLLREQHLYL